MTTRGHILLVEDDTDLRQTFQTILEIEGYTVTGATNGKHALDILEATTQMPGLILLDLMMPVMDGFQFCEHLKASGSPAAEIPIVIMSADGHAQDKQARTGAKFYLKKPTRRAQVLETVTSYIRS